MIGYAVVDLTLGTPCRWSDKDGTLYTSTRATVFKKKTEAKRAVEKAIDWWRSFAAVRGFRDHVDSTYMIVPLQEER